MFNQAFFIRILVAAVVAVIVILIVPAFLRLIGFPASSDLLLIIKLVVAGLALVYVFTGSKVIPG